MDSSLSHRSLISFYVDEDLPCTDPFKTTDLDSQTLSDSETLLSFILYLIRSTDVGYRSLQTMCQGHEDLAAPAAPETSQATAGQKSQSDHREKKIKLKQQKQQNSKVAATVPAAPVAPTHELVKTGSAKLANGTRYIDVCLLYR
jgi:hypothetical protein